MYKLPTIKADFIEAGFGPVVMLVHSSVCMDTARLRLG